jgi:hypothetical protein
MQIRPPAVAGSFYPAAPAALKTSVQALMDTATGEYGPAPKALIVPHAGYIYSGAVAARAYASLASRWQQISRVVLLGPAHYVAVAGLALPGVDHYASPLGTVALDSEAISGLRGLPQVLDSRAAHAREHSLEVQLPFLQALLGDFQLVPLAVGEAEPAVVAEVLDKLWGGPETLILISSDLSHFLDYAQARVVDGATARVIENRSGPLNHHQACGATPINGLLEVARRRDLQVRVLDLRNSGDTAGSRDRVVGYGAFGFYDQALSA